MARITAGIVSTAWAETGDKVSFEDIGDTGSRLRTEGFDSTYSQPGGKKPERELVNNELNIANNFILDVQLHGVLEWDIAVTYNTPSLVFGTDGELYKAKRNSGPTPLSPHNPVTDSAETYWEPFYKSLPALTLAQIPDLPASKTTSGVFDIARIPDLPASRITSGTFSTNRIPGLDADKIVSGVFDVDRIPGLDAGKIVSGIFNINRIPMIPADHITGFVTPSVLGAENIPITITTAQVSGTANAIILSPAPAWSSYTIGQRFLFRPNLDSTGNVTINVSSLGARQVWWWGKRLAADGFIRTRTYECVIYSSTRIHIVGVLFGDSVLYNAGSGAGNLPVLESNTQLHVDRIPDLPASRITSGVFSVDRIPNLNANKITAGILDEDRIPDLDATKITTGLLGIARIPDLSGLYASETLLASNINLPRDTLTDVSLSQTALNFLRFTIYFTINNIQTHIEVLRRSLDSGVTTFTTQEIGGTVYLLTRIGNFYSVSDTYGFTFIASTGLTTTDDFSMLRYNGVDYYITDSGDIYSITSAGVVTLEKDYALSAFNDFLNESGVNSMHYINVHVFNGKIYVYVIATATGSSPYRGALYELTDIDDSANVAYRRINNLNINGDSSGFNRAILFNYYDKLYVLMAHHTAGSSDTNSQVYLLNLANEGSNIATLIRSSIDQSDFTGSIIVHQSSYIRNGNIYIVIRYNTGSIINAKVYQIALSDAAEINGTVQYNEIESELTEDDGLLQGDTVSGGASDGHFNVNQFGFLVSGATVQALASISQAGSFIVNRNGANLRIQAPFAATIDAVYGKIN